MSDQEKSNELYNLCEQLCYDKASFDDIRRWLDSNKNNEDLLIKAANFIDEDKETPLHHLVRNQPPSDLVERLLKLAPDTVKVPNTIGWLPLHYALNFGASHDIIKMLFQAYPEAAKVQDNMGCLPLHYACWNPMDCREDFLDRLNLLVTAYPEGINVQDIDGKFPSCFLNDAVSESDHTEHLYLLHMAIKGGLSTHLIKLLVQAFPESCTTKDNDGMVPLHYACTGSSSNFLENAIVLLDAHKDSLQIEDNRGRTPLKLLSNRAKMPDEKGKLPLHRLVASSHTLTEQFLLFLVNAYPDSIRTADKYGMLPFHHACLNQELAVEVLMILLSLYPEAVKCF
jgi:ankyrin repeat protein